MNCSYCGVDGRYYLKQLKELEEEKDEILTAKLPEYIKWMEWTHPCSEYMKGPEIKMSGHPCCMNENTKLKDRVKELENPKIKINPNLDMYEGIFSQVGFLQQEITKLKAELESLEMYLGPDKWADLFGGEKKGPVS